MTPHTVTDAIAMIVDGLLSGQERSYLTELVESGETRRQQRHREAVELRTRLADHVASIVGFPRAVSTKAMKAMCWNAL